MMMLYRRDVEKECPNGKATPCEACRLFTEIRNALKEKESSRE